MSQLHICNTFFERELEGSVKKSLPEWMRSHPAVIQLQLLPLLYAKADDLILVSELPPHPDPRLCLIENAPRDWKIEDWGPSRAIQEWTGRDQLPNWEWIRTINSKIFSYQNSPKLPGSALLESEKDVLKWIELTPGPKVLKAPFGTAGTGHFHVGKSRNLDRFLRTNLPVIGEPWVERLFDFSTQWKGGQLVAATMFETDPNGTYKATIAGPKEQIFGSYLGALEEHVATAEPLVRKIGYLGHLGIDAYVYRVGGQERVQPIVEINGRKTMSWVAFQIQQKSKPERSLRFAFSGGDNGLLPQMSSRFTRNISLSRKILTTT